ncbi:glutamate ligase domain-containing protein, partial [Sphingomonas sp. 10B4]|uniref:glutamate ligase domain-containing protein n=1 Tax=Sphingomonas sp. 10B4 TaxID=3048575 RepID=UPI002B23CD22
ALRHVLPVGAQEVRTGLVMVDLPGRFQVMPGRPTVVLDVAHNPHAAATLSQNLDNMGFHAYTYAVFGSMLDKDVAGVIAQLKQKIDHWHVCDLPLLVDADTGFGASAFNVARTVKSMIKFGAAAIHIE